MVHTTWMNLENTVLGERKPGIKDHFRFHLHEMSRINTSIYGESSLVVTLGRGWG